MSDEAVHPKPALVRDPSRPLPFRPAARAVFDLSLEGMVWTRRSLLMAVLVGMPVVFAILYRVVLASSARVQPVTPRPVRGDRRDLLDKQRSRSPALFYATALIADEVEGRRSPTSSPGR
jgi:hypothetical protein